MSYIVIARRWRPQQFNEIISQEHVSKTLSNAIAHNRIAHAYIFTGPRGIGKTTTARILAKALNCEKGPTPTPCNECASCKAITLGNSLDVLEIDGASNRGIDEIRNLRENIRFTPTLGKYRIYIIDEVHMLTKEAFNALLKTLEEPPSHALFIFATTEIHKVPSTILSRCQRFDFKRIPIRVIMEHLRYICQEDKIQIAEEALLQIAKKADGSMRDAQSILDQIISFSGEKITFEDVAQALGVIHQDLFFRISALILQGDVKGILLLSQEIFNSGYDLTELLIGLEEHFRNILVTLSTRSTELIDASENYLLKYEEIAAEFSEADLIAYLKIIGETIITLKTSQQPQLKLELGLIKLTKLPAATDIQTILEKFELLKKKAQSDRVTELVTPAYNSNPANNVTAVSPLNLIDIREGWNSLVQEIQKQKPTLAAVFEKSVPEKLEAETLTIRVDLIDPFQKDLIHHNRNLIEQCMTNLVRHKVKLKFEYTMATQQRENGVQKNLSQEDKEKIVQKLRSEDELMAKLIDEFDLELL